MQRLVRGTILEAARPLEAEPAPFGHWTGSAIPILRKKIEGNWIFKAPLPFFAIQRRKDVRKFNQILYHQFVGEYIILNNNNTQYIMQQNNSEMPFLLGASNGQFVFFLD